MIDIREFSLWLIQLFVTNSFYYTLFISNISFNLGVFAVGFFNFVTYRKQYSIFFLLISAGVTFNHLVFGISTFGVINPQLYYLSIQYIPLTGCLVVFFFLKKMVTITYPKFFIAVCAIFFLLSFYASFLPPFLQFSILLHTVNIALKAIVFGFLIQTGYYAYTQQQIERLFFVIATFIGVTVIIIDFPPIFSKQQLLNYVYPFKLIVLFFNTLVHASLLGYLSAKIDKQFVTQQAEVIKLANENQHLLLNQKAILEQQVAERTLELQKSNTLKDKLFATIGHDLRNAVVILKISLSIFDKKKQDNTHQMQKQVDGLYNTLDNLLEWSVLQLNRNKPTSEIISVKDSVDDCLDFLSYNLRQKNIRVILAIKATDIYINEHHLSIILRNLVSNSIKFTPVNGSIKITTSSINHYTELAIVDTGIGISPYLLATLFSTTSFQSRTGTEGETGTGLGLKLCKELIESQGGILKIESEVNKGTSVKIRFLH